MGVALGCIHLSLDDFLRLTPEEFDDIYKAYSDDREAVYRSGREQTRILAAIVIAPHVKRPPSPQELFRCLGIKQNAGQCPTQTR